MDVVLSRSPIVSIPLSAIEHEEFSVMSRSQGTLLSSVENTLSLVLMLVVIFCSGIASVFPMLQFSRN